MDALKISQKGPNVILKRNVQDVFINTCNLKFWICGVVILIYNMSSVR